MDWATGNAYVSALLKTRYMYNMFITFKQNNKYKSYWHHKIILFPVSCQISLLEYLIYPKQHVRYHVLILTNLLHLQNNNSGLCIKEYVAPSRRILFFQWHFECLIFHPCRPTLRNQPTSIGFYVIVQKSSNHLWHRKCNTALLIKSYLLSADILITVQHNYIGYNLDFFYKIPVSV